VGHPAGTEFERIGRCQLVSLGKRTMIQLSSETQVQKMKSGPAQA